MRFWKYQGLGNDFILIDGTEGGVVIDPGWCEMMCDRHFGIGADGVLYVMPGEGTDITMRIINADGSEAEMCGNGIRCVAKYAYDKGLVDREVFTIHTLAGDLKATVFPEEGEVRTVRIDMGAPILEGRQVPVDFDGRFIDQPFEADGVSFRANAVSMGNPHFITFTEMDDATVDRLGPILECHPFFPRKTNVEFCRVEDGKIYIRVYERGAAWTLGMDPRLRDGGVRHHDRGSAQRTRAVRRARGRAPPGRLAQDNGGQGSRIRPHGGAGGAGLRGRDRGDLR